MSLIDNERTKLLANALDRASTASLALGVFAPVAAAFYGAQTGGEVPWPTLIIGAFIWLAGDRATFSGKTRARRAAATNGMQLFAFVILPIVIVTGGWVAAWLHLRSLRHHHRPPGE